MSSLIHVTVLFIKHLLLPYLIYHCSINYPKDARGVFKRIYILILSQAWRFKNETMMQKHH